MSGTDYIKTPTLGLFKPNYDMDDDQWGYHLNINADILDAYLSPGGNPAFVPVAGGTMTGLLALSGDPTDPLHAVTKQYLDTHSGTGSQIYAGGWDPVANVPTLASGALANGALTPKGTYYICTIGGTSVAIDGLTTWLAGDFITSNGTIWQRVQAASSPYLPLTGGTVSGTTTVGTNAAAATFNVNGQAAANRRIAFRTASSDRWRIQANTFAEAGSNAGSDLDIVALADDGSTGTTAVRFTRASGNIEFFKNTTLSGTTHTFKGGILRTQAINYSGTQANPGNYFLWTTANYTGTSSDSNFFTLNNLAGVDTIDNQQSRALLGVSYTASTGVGGGGGIDLRCKDGATTGRPLYGMIGLRSTVTWGFNQGGTSSALVGANWALLLAMGDGAGPAGLYHNAARMIEMDMSVNSATSVGSKGFLKMSGDVSDLSTGLLDADYYMCFVRGNAAGATWRYGLTFTTYDGLFPFATKSTLIDGGRLGNGYSAANGYKIGWGVDFNALDPQSGAFRSKGFFVDVDGTVQVGAMRASFATGSGGAVDMNGIVATSIAYSSGGTGWTTGQSYMLADTTGNLVGMGVLGTVTGGVPNAASISGGTVVRLPVLRSATSPPATLTVTAVKGASLTPGTDFVVSVTWNTAATGLSLNPTGQKIGFNGAAPIAKPTLTGSRGGNAALASVIAALVSYGLATDTTTA